MQIHPFVDLDDQRFLEDRQLWNAALAPIDHHGGDGGIVVMLIPKRETAVER